MKMSHLVSWALNQLAKTRSANASLRRRKGAVRPAASETFEKREVMSATAFEVVAPNWFQQLPQAQAASPSQSTNVRINGQTIQMNKNEWIVRLNEAATNRVGGVAKSQALFAGAPFQVQVTGGLGLPGQLSVKVTGAPSVNHVLRYFQGHKDVANAEPNAIVKGTQLPNDPGFDLQYGLHNSGQTGGVADADIDAPEAWDRTTGNSNVVVGVIDTGVDYTHPDLANNMWQNPGEIPNNGIDDDQNGFQDDIFGYDFFNNDADPMDDHYHGTHVAGTIAADGNNSEGVTGVAWDASIMAIKFLGPNGGTTQGAIRAINYTTMMRSTYGVNIRITNNSWGGGAFSQELSNAIDAHGKAGILFVAAAGNSASNNDQSPHYPSSYPHSNIVAVAATNSADRLAGFSNTGSQSVDLAAPGEDIASTVPGDYAYLSGTSMATPHVSGVAALGLSLKPNATVAELKSALMNGVDKLESLSGKVLTGGRLNAAKMLDLLVPPPSTPTAIVNDVDLVEGNSGTKTAIFTITLNQPATSTVRIDFTTKNDTAAHGNDYERTSGTVTIPVGQQTAQFSIRVYGDVRFESNENFQVLLSNARGAQIADGVGVATIINDEVGLTGGATQLGAWEHGHNFLLDTAGDGTFAEKTVGFGLPGDKPFAGDINGDGKTDLIVARENRTRGGIDWYIDIAGDGYLQERLMRFGLIGDIPVVGDWNGDGKTDLGAVRANTRRGGLDWYLDLKNDGNNAERVMQYGLLGDKPVVGDWNNDGRDDLGVVRDNLITQGLDWYLDLANNGGLAERVVSYGLRGDTPMVGDWNNDGRDDFAVVRFNVQRDGQDWYLDRDNNGGNAELIMEYGLQYHTPVAGKWRR